MWQESAFSTCRDFADGGGVEGVVVVAVARLHEDGRVGEAVREHLPVDVAKLDPWNETEQD